MRSFFIEHDAAGDTTVHVAIGDRDKAWQIVMNILRQLRGNDDGCSGVAIELTVVGEDLVADAETFADEELEP